MDFDPNPPTGERNRSGPRWYSVVAFLTIAFLLLLNAVAMFVNAEANEERACWAEPDAWQGYYGGGTPPDPETGRRWSEYVYGLLMECSKEFGDD